MATALELCKRVTLELGIGPGDPGDNPTTIANQTGKLRSVVTWVKDAWRTIQNKKRFWRWMIDEAVGEETVAIGDSSVTLVGDNTDFDRLLAYDPNCSPYVLFYQTSIGITDAQPVYILPWQEFNGYYDSGRFSASSGRPQFCAVAPDGTLRFHPKASAEYKLKYQYKKTVQELTADGDIPLMPVKFHDLIWMLACSMYGKSNEANRVVEYYGIGLIDNRNPDAPLPALYRELCKEQMADTSFFGDR